MDCIYISFGGIFMRKNKFIPLILAALAFTQCTVVYAASSKDEEYTKEELDNLTPGFEWEDKDKSNYRVDSFTNTFSSPQAQKEAKDKDKKSDDTKKETSTTTTEPKIENNIISTRYSTGRSGDFWGVTSDGKWILIEQGAPASGWKLVGGKWYYMDPNGVMQTGWLQDNGKWYYLWSNGEMAVNTIIDGYRINYNGVMV